MRIFLVWIWILFPGCWALTGPHEAKGPLGGELSVQCSYVRGYETYIKYWCRGTMQTSCHVVVQTSDSEATVKQDRVSIRDIRTNNTFIVTMKNLTEGDSGIYWCGIEELGWDRMFSVKVSVLPAVSASPMPAPEKEPKVDATCMESPCTWTVLQVTESNSTVHSSDPSARATNPPLHILLPCILLVPLLILIIAVVFVKTSRRRNKGFRMDRRDCSTRHSDISDLTSTYVNIKPKTRSTTPPSHGQPKHGEKATA